MFRDPYAGLYHILIFSGFVVLSVRTVSLVLEGLFPGAGMPFLPAGFWEGYLLLKDVVLLTTLAGVLLALGRRHVFRKARLDPSFDADLILGLIGLLMVTDLGAGGGAPRAGPAGSGRRRERRPRRTCDVGAPDVFDFPADFLLLPRLPSSRSTSAAGGPT